MQQFIMEFVGLLQFQLLLQFRTQKRGKYYTAGNFRMS